VKHEADAGSRLFRVVCQDEAMGLYWPYRPQLVPNALERDHHTGVAVSRTSWRPDCARKTFRDPSNSQMIGVPLRPRRSAIKVRHTFLNASRVC
jgi:hypothetical protein